MCHFVISNDENDSCGFELSIFSKRVIHDLYNRAVFWGVLSGSNSMMAEPKIKATKLARFVLFEVNVYGSR